MIPASTGCPPSPRLFPTRFPDTRLDGLVSRVSCGPFDHDTGEHSPAFPGKQLAMAVVSNSYIVHFIRVLLSLSLNKVSFA